MKKILLCIAVVCAIAGVWALTMHKTAKPDLVQAPPQKAKLFAADGTYCFVYTHTATKDTPYMVEEHLSLTKSGTVISGTKRGMQSGPDMTNGYTGTITGTVSPDGSHIDDTFTYTVEGATQTEQEIYQLNEEQLKKLRYELHDSHGVLVPDLTTPPALLTYAIEPC